MSENFCHKVANESLFVALSTVVLLMVALVAHNLFWLAVVIILGKRAAFDLGKVAVEKKEERSPGARNELAVC